MKASDAAALILHKHNVTYGFELVGGMITHLIDSINLFGKTKLISLHHEQSAAFAAGGVARVTNNVQLGVALGTSGPGATNLITGVADCWLDSVPCLFLTGQVNSYELKGDKKIRQQGFQELDSVSLVETITKYAIRITSPKEFISELDKALTIAVEGRPGPVLLDIPMDIQRQDIPEDYVDEVINRPSKFSFDNSKPIKSSIDETIEKLLRAKKPLILIGGGAVKAKGFGSWYKQIINSKVPVVSSLKGSEQTTKSDTYFGMIGSYGKRIANYAVQECDFLLVLGSRLDVRQTGADVKRFAPKADILQIDLDGAQLNNRVPCVSFECDLKNLYSFWAAHEFKLNIQEWLSELSGKRTCMEFDEYKDWSISPYRVFTRLNKLLSGLKVSYSVDVGNNQMWAAHSLELEHTQSAHYSGGLGTMGFSLPNAIGMSYATCSNVVVISGDGGLQMNIQELDIISRENLPILVLVFNNRSLGMVKGFQDLYFESRNTSTYWGGYTSDFIKIAQGYYIEATRVKDLMSFESKITSYIDNPRPMLIELDMPDAKECRPRLEFGEALDNQSPKLN